MNMTSRITGDCQSVASHLRVIIQAECMHLPLHVQRALENNARILTELANDVRKDNQETQDKIMDIEE